VVLLNRASSSHWAQEGIYISSNADVANPDGWSTPRKILDRKAILAGPNPPMGWYPQVIGLDRAQRDTDKQAGQVARLFVHGTSRWEIVFSRPGETK
jgi:hypothetical protein